ncbi:hypothetical protein [Flavobacterium sp.]|uniref:hypothetical protein n=1 Tax=Flavobacterium sp. TaxID=239 RepID=UPI001207E131|nr:hypothetical protein [Flavobacterium sp.]RZJ73981.1 MAG: hypothetical protein EOO49_01095 [Flavobacterium sp.]
MKLQHKIKSYFKQHDFHLWKDLRLDEGLCFAHPTEEMLVEIAGYLRDNLSEVTILEDKRFRLREKSAVAFSSIDELMPFLSKILSIDFSETSKESAIYDWEFTYQLKPHLTSEHSISLVNAVTSLKKEHSHCVYTLVSMRKFEGKIYCWTF